MGIRVELLMELLDNNATVSHCFLYSLNIENECFSKLYPIVPVTLI